MTSSRTSERSSFRAWAVYCALAGGGDAVTGILLMSAPLFTLRLMGIAPPPTEPVFLQFVGAFVAGVGLCYGLPFLGQPGEPRRSRLVAIFDATAFIRLSVAGFVFFALAQGELVPAWKTVAITDVVLALFQIFARRHLLAPADGPGDIT